MSWSQIVEQRRIICKLGYAFFALALVAAVLGFFVPVMDGLPIMLALLGMQAAGAVPLLQRIADQQAIIDMRNVHRDLSAPAGVITIRPGEVRELQISLAGSLTGKIKLRSHTTSKLEILP